MIEFPALLHGFDPDSGVDPRYHKRAQNGPGIAVVEHRPGPDLSASLDVDEEH